VDFKRLPGGLALCGKKAGRIADRKYWGPNKFVQREMKSLALRGFGGRHCLAAASAAGRRLDLKIPSIAVGEGRHKRCYPERDKQAQLGGTSILPVHGWKEVFPVLLRSSDL
jgi:hypothetical protein